MNPFLEIPVYLPGEREVSVTSLFGKKTVIVPETPAKVVTGRIIPGEIAYHYPDEHNRTRIVLRCGTSLITTWTCDEVDYARQTYSTYLVQFPKNKNNVQLTRPDEKPAAENKLVKV